VSLANGLIRERYRIADNGLASPMTFKNASEASKKKNAKQGECTIPLPWQNVARRLPTSAAAIKRLHDPPWRHERNPRAAPGCDDRMHRRGACAASAASRRWMVI